MLTVPAYNLLYSDHDLALGHYRRYTAAALKSILPAELRVLYASYYNTLLFPAAVATRLAWQVKRKIFGASNTVQKQPVPGSGCRNTVLGRIFSL